MSGWIAEFGSGEAALEAARRLRERGRSLELFAPYELKGAAEVLGVPRPQALPRATLAGGLLGAAAGYLIQWYTAAVSYPVDVGSRPLHSAPAFIPITFETTVLLGAFGAFFGCLALARLPRLWQPVFEVPGFESATRDGFWLAVEADAARADEPSTRELLRALGARRVERFGDAA